MGYFDGLVNVSFKKADDGKTIFYPYGSFSAGYIVSEDKESAAKTFLKKYYIISLIVIIIAIVFFKLFALALSIFFIPIYYFKVKKIIVGAEPTQQKNTYKERIKNMAKAFGPVISLVMLIIDLIMLGASVVCVFIPQARAIGIVGALFFGAGLIQTVFLVKYSLEEKKKSTL